MSWQVLKGMRPIGQLSQFGKVLKLDGANDQAQIPNSEFYNFGTGDFTLFTRFLALNAHSTAAKNAVSKNSDQADTLNEPNYSIGVRNNRIQAAVSDRRSGTIKRLLISSTDGAVEFNNFSSVIFGRGGGTNEGNLVADNYLFMVNGIRYTNYDQDLLAEFVDASVDNSKLFAIGGAEGTNSNCLKGYLSAVAVWNRALSDPEIDNLNNSYVISPDGNRGTWEFSQNFGKDLIDSSSVKQNGVLLNYTDEETGSINPATNRVWIPEDGILIFSADGTKEFTAGRDLLVNKIARGFNNYLTGTATHKRGLTVLNTYNLGFATDHLEPNLNIDMKQGDTLEIAVSNVGSSPSSIEIFY